MLTGEGGLSGKLHAWTLQIVGALGSGARPSKNHKREPPLKNLWPVNRRRRFALFIKQERGPCLASEVLKEFP